MTTPNQVGPDGAFTIGGGGWGQDGPNNLAAILPPPPNPLAAFDQFQQLLNGMPLEVLQVFEPFVDATEGAFADAGNAVQAILDALQASPIYLAAEDFFRWVGEFFEPLTQAFERLLSILSGNILEPAGDAFDAVIAWLGDLLNMDKFGEAIGAVIDWVIGIPGDVLDALADLLGLDFTGLNEFFASIFLNIKNLTGLDLTTPTAFFASIANLVNQAIDNLATTVNEVTQILAQVFGYKNPPANLTVPQLILWVGGNVLGKLVNLTTNGLLSVGALLGIIPVTQVDGPGDFTNIGAAVEKAWADTQANLDKWYSALTGRPQTSATAELTANEIAELLATTTANASALAALQAVTQGGLTNMVASGDDFERPTLNPTPMWRQVNTPSTPAGNYSLSNGQMFWADSGNAQQLVQFFRDMPADRNTFTPYQKITRVNGTVIAEKTLLTAGPGVDFIYGRVNAAGTGYVYVAADGDGKVTLGFTTTGPAGEAAGVLSTVTATAPTAGATYALECGDAASVRNFRVLRNNITVLSFSDTAGRTAALDNNTGWGWGGRAVPRFAGQSSPGSIHSITVADIPPNPTIGSYLQVTRGVTTPVRKLAGPVKLPDNTWTQRIRTSPDILVDLPTGIFTITKPGPYTAALRLDTGTDQTPIEEWELLLFTVSGTTDTLIRRVGMTGAPFGINGATTNTVDGVFQFYADKPNSQFRFGFNTNADENIIGNANGDTTYFTVMRGS